MIGNGCLHNVVMLIDVGVLFVDITGQSFTNNFVLGSIRTSQVHNDPSCMNS